MIRKTIPDPLVLSSSITAQSLTLTAASGANAITMLTGSRLSLNAGGTIYLSNNTSDHVTLTGAGRFVADVIFSSSISCTHSTNPLFLVGQVNDSGGARTAISIGAFNNLTNASSKIAVFVNNNTTEKACVYATGQLGFPTGGAADVVGTATLVGGTVTVSTTAVGASSKIFLSRNTTGGTLGDLSAPVGSIVAATSFVINSSSGSETSTVNWMIVNK